MSSCDHAKTSLYSLNSSINVVFSLGIKTFAIESDRGSAMVSILTSPNAEAVTLREIYICLSNATRALLNSISDSGLGSYSSS